MQTIINEKIPNILDELLEKLQKEEPTQVGFSHWINFGNCKIHLNDDDEDYCHISIDYKDLSVSFLIKDEKQKEILHNIFDKWVDWR
ncbi:hypothetical protein [uncultured Brachyspira sp.]|uniref:hypothetical protein n=1 Tax=uncultured Brachyspira sp. TaxID=221953 RepID=UPI00262728DB|nr:hypothetical protein [uncultured Brachyspira sp.]